MAIGASCRVCAVTNIVCGWRFVPVLPVPESRQTLETIIGDAAEGHRLRLGAHRHGRDRDREVPLDVRPIQVMPGVSEVLPHLTFPLALWANTRLAQESDVRAWLFDPSARMGDSDRQRRSPADTGLSIGSEIEDVSVAAFSFSARRELQRLPPHFTIAPSSTGGPSDPPKHREEP